LRQNFFFPVAVVYSLPLNEFWYISTNRRLYDERGSSSTDRRSRNLIFESENELPQFLKIEGACFSL